MAGDADGTVEAYVSLGSNLGDREATLARAVALLRETPGVSEVALSPVYDTDPVGPPPQGPHLNAVARVRTTLSPRALLERLLEVERACGRTRSGVRHEARVLDLDLLLYEGRVLDEPGLAVPHPRMAERPFVLEPLCDLAPDLVHPLRGATISELARRVRDPRAVRPWHGSGKG